MELTQIENKKGWNYQYHKSLEYVLFIVKFDDKVISTRILDELPSEEECLSMMCDTKEEFLKKLLD